MFRAGLLVFVGFVLWGNTRDLLGNRAPEAPYGFGLFLCCLDYLAAKRALDRGQAVGLVASETGGGEAHSAFDCADRVPGVTILSP